MTGRVRRVMDASAAKAACHGMTKSSIISSMKSILRLLSASFLLIGVVQGCDFHVQPTALPHYYRESGWKLPDVDHWRFSAPATFAGPGSLEATLRFGPSIVSGLTSRLKVGDSDQTELYVFEIPKQEFKQDGKAFVMSAQKMVIRGSVWRYDLDGKVVAYTVSLTPVEARRVNGHWELKGEVACIFYGTFIDDKGDGIFRLLVPGWMKPDLIPQWALKREQA